MKTLLNLSVPKDTALQFPFGNIINETDAQEGTPVIREIYGEILVNLYKLIQLAGIELTNDEDSDLTQYQLVEAIRKLPNLHNDAEQVLTLTGGNVWSVPLKFSILPNRYVFMARTSDAYVGGTSYTIAGNEVGGDSYPLTSPTGFGASDVVMVVLDQSGARVYSLTSLTAAPMELLMGLGLPIAYNDSDKLFYQEAGNLLSDLPSVDYLENVIRVASGEGTLLVNDILVSQGFALCFCYIPATNRYAFYQFDLTDLGSADPVMVSGFSFGTGTDRAPYVYMAQDGFLYVTNLANTSADNYRLVCYLYNPGTPSLEFVSQFAINSDFVKTSNAVVFKNVLYTFVDGLYRGFNLAGATYTELGTFNGVIGNLFMYQDKPYFCTGEVAKRWG